MYTQVTQLFNSAPDLLEDFKQFLPESAAHAKQQAAARQAEEAAPMSNLRGDPNFQSSSLTSQTPIRDVKMPPLGNFNVKDSAKEGKKRRNVPGAPGLGGSGVGPAGGVDTARMGDSQAGRGQAMAASNANKVSYPAIIPINSTMPSYTHIHLPPSIVVGLILLRTFLILGLKSVNCGSYNTDTDFLPYNPTTPTTPFPFISWCLDHIRTLC